MNLPGNNLKEELSNIIVQSISCPIILVVLDGYIYATDYSNYF